MSKALVSESKLTAIADAVRSKTGGQAELTLDQMVTAIDGIPTVDNAAAILVSNCGANATVTATDGTDTIVATSDSNQKAQLWINKTGTWAISSNGAVGTASATVSTLPCVIETSISILPSQYQMVEYIQGNGAVCLDTGIAVDGQNYIKMIMMPGGQPSSSSWDSVFGIDINSKKIQLGYRGSDSAYYYNYGSGSTNLTLGTTFTNNKITFEVVDSKLYWSFSGGTGNAGTVQSFTGVTAHWYLLACGNSSNSGHGNPTKGKIYYCEIGTDQDHIVYKGYPCYLRSDTTQIGMYDLVSNTFNTGTGTGAFTKGADV